MPPRKSEGIPWVSTRFSLSMENEQADAGRDGQTRLARPSSQAQTGTGNYQFSLFSWIRTGLGNLTRLIHSLLLYKWWLYIHKYCIKSWHVPVKIITREYYLLCVCSHHIQYNRVVYSSAAGDGLPILWKTTHLSLAHIISDCFDAQGGTNRSITLCCVCAPSFVTRDRFCASI